MHSHKINFLFSKWVGKSLGADVLTNRPTDVLSITFLVFCICLLFYKLLQIHITYKRNYQQINYINSIIILFFLLFFASKGIN